LGEAEVASSTEVAPLAAVAQRSGGASEVDWASRKLVARMLARATARPVLLDALVDEIGRASIEVASESVALPAVPPSLPRTAAVSSAIASGGDGVGGGAAGSAAAALSEKRASRPSVRAEAAEVCRRLLYVCVFAASVNVHCVAQLLLLHAYRRACRRRLDEDEVIMPLAQPFCWPIDWGRCAATCRALRNFGFGALRTGFTATVRARLREYTAEARDQVLKMCVHHNVLAMLRPLTEAGADMNCVFEQYWFRTPLHRAASRGNVEMCRQLLALRANSAIRDSHGAAPMHLVASKGRLSIVELLLQHDPECAGAADFSGRTPYHMAALKGHLNVVKCLIAARADYASDRSADGRTPLEMARRGQHTHVVEYLERRARREEEDVPAARQLIGELFRRTVAASAVSAASRPPPRAASPTPSAGGGEAWLREP